MSAAPSPMHPLKVDLHMHTLDDPQDHHVRHTAFELIDRAAHLGYSALAITLHGVQLEHARVEDYARRRNLLLIPGVEQNIEGAHVLLLNFPKAVADRIRTFADLAAHRRPDRLVIAAHPYYPGRVCLGPKLEAHADLFDAVEHSGFYHRFWNPNRRARLAAERLGKPLVGDSDTHTLEQFGCTWSEVEGERSVAGVIAAIKAGKVRVRTRPLGLRELLRIGFKVVALGYCKWINYKRSRGYTPLA